MYNCKIKLELLLLLLLLLLVLLQLLNFIVLLFNQIIYIYKHM